jgi:hypothetical protein
MKNYFSILTAAVLMLFSFSASAQFSYSPALKFAITNLSGNIGTPTNVFVVGSANAASTTNIVSPATNAGPRNIIIPANTGVGFWATAGTTNLGTTANFSFVFDLTVDGTNWTTTTNFYAAVPLSGMSRAVLFTNFAPALLNNARGIRIGRINNDNTNTTFLTNCYFTVYQ